MPLDLKNLHYMTRRTFVMRSAALAAALATSSAATPGAFADEAPAFPKLAIVHTNDTHGHDVAVATTDTQTGNLSMASVPQLAHDLEASGYEVLVLDAGDATHDTVLVDESFGSTAIDMMNAAGYQAMCVGNHEFDWGIENLKNLAAKANFPILSANVVDAVTGDPVMQTHTVLETASGYKVGIFGLTTPTVLTTAPPGSIDGYTVLSGDELVTCAQEQVDALHTEGCDLVVCLGHMGYRGTAEPHRSVDLLNGVSGIDIFLDGHDHLTANSNVGGTLLVETGCYMHNIGVITYEEGVFTSELVQAANYDAVDADCEAVIDAINAEVQESVSQVVANTPFVLNGERDPGVRTEETNLGDFVADAYLASMRGDYTDGEVDACVVNGGSIRTSIQSGDITFGDVKEVLPYDAQLVAFEITGAQLLEALEAAAWQAPNAGGSFPQVSGIAFTLDTSVEYEKGELYPNSTYYAPANPGSRVQISDVNGKGFDLDATYTICSTDFTAQGGDTYGVFKDASSNGLTYGSFDYEALEGYLTNACGGTVPAEYEEPRDRIQMI